MKILFTGGSSFTGFWFIRELARAGHEVVAVFRKKPEEYPDDVRKVRARRSPPPAGRSTGAALGMTASSSWRARGASISCVTMRRT
jgi:nucleoside-diphosphate-sugar epimerase